MHKTNQALRITVIHRFYIIIAGPLLPFLQDFMSTKSYCQANYIFFSSISHEFTYKAKHIPIKNMDNITFSKTLSEPYPSATIGKLGQNQRKIKKLQTFS
jgi:hypothetical protein